MKKLFLSIAIVAMAITMVSCGNKTGQAGGADSTVTDSTAADSVVTAAGDNKHTPDYVRQRVDSIYSPYKNPKYDKVGMRLMKPRGNFDDMYCSTRYKVLLAKAEAMTGDDDILLDYDHWTNSQDDNNFTCEVGKISNMTDSTAVVQVKAKNGGKGYDILLSLIFERDDWYVDDFLPTAGDDGESEKVYFERYIREAPINRIKEFYRVCVYGGEIPTEDMLKNYCTKKLMKKLRDDYDYDGEGFAIWDFTTPEVDRKGTEVKDVKALGNNKYKVITDDPLATNVITIVIDNGIRFDDVVNVAK